jgi:hypothetical protein
MAYFNHAYQKSFLPAELEGSIDWVVSGDTSDLTAGQVGFFDAKTYSALSAPSSKPFILAQGSYYTNDKIGPFHGGYKESVKSKIINPKYINKIWTACANPPQQQIVSVGWDLESDPGAGFLFECGKTYNLRIDLKGSPALRFLSHNVYKTVSAYSGCCTDDCSATCTGAAVDAACVLLKWADYINQDPILSQFIQAAVYVNDGGDAIEVFTASYECVTGDAAAEVVAGLELSVAYVDTKFGNCTFTPTDHYELQPLQILTSVVDESGDPCAIKPTSNASDGVLFTEIQPGIQAQGVGETVLRNLILSGRYQQEAFPDNKYVDSLRMREIESNPSLVGFDRNALYDSINILHSVPRFNNPTGTFDNDQYLLTLWLPTGTDAQAFLGFLQDVLNCAGNGVEIENTNGQACSNLVPAVPFVESCEAYPTTTTTTAAPTTTTTTVID